MKLFTHLQLMLRSRKRRSIHPFPLTSSCHNAQLVKWKKWEFHNYKIVLLSLEVTTATIDWYFYTICCVVVASKSSFLVLYLSSLARNELLTIHCNNSSFPPLMLLPQHTVVLSRATKSSNLLLAFGSKVIFSFSLCLASWTHRPPQDHLYFEMGLLSDERKGLSLCDYYEQSCKLLLACASTLCGPPYITWTQMA
jgi:hypothetical protein